MMDIDVKNAYTKAMHVCGEKGFYSLISQIKGFVEYISINDADARFEEFCNIYVQRDIDKNIIGDTENSELSVNADVIDFFTVLGKYYLFSRFDKKDINKNKFTEFIKKMSVRAMSKEPAGALSAGAKVDGIAKSEEYQKSSDSEDDTNSSEEIQPEETLEELKEKLHSMIGLQGVKEEVDQIINLISLQKRGEELGEKVHPLSLHLVFYGNPGTGKTTVARLLAKIYRALGVLSKGQLIETDRGGLVGGYVGQTAIKTQEVIDRAMGGILFIDEAYSLTHGKGESDFGQEAVDTILKAMEDHRDDFIVIVAGYPDLMKEFIASNPGLKSRFNQYINFEDYTPDQLCDIFRLQCDEQNLVLGDGCEEFLIGFFNELYEKRAEDYANGRDVRNYFEKVTRMRANRLSPNIDVVTREEFKTIEVSDLEKASELKKESF